MKQLEEIIKMALKEELKGLSLERTPMCPDESLLADYLCGALSGKKKKEIELHIMDCLVCTENLILADKAAGLENKKMADRNLNTWLKKNVWLIFAMISFVLSFMYARYFIQFLVATLILAGKWLFNSVNARILIMIYEAWKKGGEKEVGKFLDRFDNPTMKR